MNEAQRREPENEFVPAIQNEGGTMDIATTRAAQEVQAAMVIAKRFPRDQNAAYSKIMQACKRRGLAEKSQYVFPRGDTTVSGPSVRLAEELARSWGNLDFGIIELDQQDGESTCMSYAWDLETNTRQTKIFTVKHERHTKRGVYKLTDPRDIYEATANAGARRMRACILGVIPGDLVEDAIEECERTLAGGSSEPLADRVRRMIAAFAEMNITQEMIEKRLNHKLEVTSEAELVALRKIYMTLRDSMADPAAYFDIPKNASAKTIDLNERIKTNGDASSRQSAVDEPTGTAPTDADAADPADDEAEAIEPWEQAMELLAAKGDISREAAGQRLAEHCNKVYRADLPDLDDGQLAELIQRIERGEIAVKAGK